MNGLDSGIGPDGSLQSTAGFGVVRSCADVQESGLLPHVYYSEAAADAASLMTGGLKDDASPHLHHVVQQQQDDHITGARAETEMSSSHIDNGAASVMSSGESSCGACQGRHRRHKCGRERADVGESFKDESCAACVGKHRPHSCIKGKPEHLRQRKRSKVNKSTSGEDSADHGSQSDGSMKKDAFNPLKEAAFPTSHGEADASLHSNVGCQVYVSSQGLTAAQALMGVQAPCAGQMPGVHVSMVADSLFAVHAPSSAQVLVGGHGMPGHQDLLAEQALHLAHALSAGQSAGGRSSASVGEMLSSDGEGGQFAPRAQGDNCGACVGKHRKHMCGRERAPNESGMSPSRDPSCHACSGRHRAHSCGREKPRNSPSSGQGASKKHMSGAHGVNQQQRHEHGEQHNQDMHQEQDMQQKDHQRHHDDHGQVVHHHQHVHSVEDVQGDQHLHAGQGVHQDENVQHVQERVRHLDQEQHVHQDADDQPLHVDDNHDEQQEHVHDHVDHELQHDDQQRHDHDHDDQHHQHDDQHTHASIEQQILLGGGGEGGHVENEGVLVAMMPI